ncbi:MFS transporter [Alteromonas sp. KUL49]|uniref:MFS transporter n=1 Tax=Alteromonas sp. KUL49 TaxID=2480798 RepID=UPI00102F26C2|nr:MFS transporter [Alteromonas sp. KUL49]TAP39297.1 MFS transporter [Alteromonas sp. KUL49]GEA12083.1 MFS transporter [Alteromonas sp. KUL49]
MNALELRTSLALALVYVLRMLGLFMVMPVIAIAAMDYPDYSPLYVGLAVGGYGLTQAALQIPMGMLSDKWGRKPVILLGLAVFALGSFIAAMSDTMLGMIVGRVLQGAGAIAGAIMALATDVSRESQRAKVLAVIGIAIGFSFYLAVLLGPLIANAWGMAGIFGVTGLLALLCMPLIVWVVPQTSIVSSGDTLPQKGQLSTLFFSSQLWRLNVSVLLLHMLITLLFTQLPLTLLKFDLALEEHWSLYLPVLGASIVGLVIMMGMARGRTPKSYLVTAVVMLAVALGGLSGLDQRWWLVLSACILFFVGFNYLEANFPALVSSIAPAGQKGTAMGIYASFQFFGAFLGGMLSGVITELASPEMVYAIGAGIALLWLLLLLGLNEVSRIQRVTLAINSGAANPHIIDTLMGQPGVEEVTLNSNHDAVYLKVTRDFNMTTARQVVDSSN